MNGELPNLRAGIGTDRNHNINVPTPLRASLNRPLITLLHNSF